MSWTTGVQFPAMATVTLFAPTSKPALGSTHHLTQWVTHALSSGVKRPRHEAHHSHSSAVEVKNAWSYTSTPHASRRDA